MLSLAAVFALAWLPLALSNVIDNQLTGLPKVDCQDTMVSLTFSTGKPFSGRVYVQGLADDDRCSRSFATNADQTQFSLMINQGDCNMGRQRVTGGEMEGLVFSLTIVVSFHGTFVTMADRAFRCMCFFRNVKRVTNFLDMSGIGTTELLDTAPMPSCTYTIHQGSADGPALRYGKVGDAIYHVWQCDDASHGFLVHSCFVNDGRNNRFDLLDVDGCAIDPIIQPDVSYDPAAPKAWVGTMGYKFSDTTALDYMCVLELCKRAQGECDGLTPPQCGKGRKRRAMQTLSVSSSKLAESDSPREGHSEMDLASRLNMLGIEDEELGFSGPSRELLSRLNTPQLPPAAAAERFCVSLKTFGAVVALMATLCASALIVVAVVCVRKGGRSRKSV